LVDVCHEGGAVVAIQLFWQPPEGREDSTSVTRDDIETALEQFATAARIAIEAGFDGVEPHGAHHFLPNQFFSPERNRRTDEYGGDLAGRMRMGLEVVRRVRGEIGDALLLYRHTPVWDYPLEESLEYATKLVEAGVDILDISPSSHQAPADLAAPFKERVGVPVIGVGRLDLLDRATEAIGNGRCDLLAIGRGQIADPQWALKVWEGRPEDIIECLECNEGCYGNLRAGLPVQCVQSVA